MGLRLTIKTGSSLVIGDHTIVRVVSVRGGQAKLEIISTEDVEREKFVDAEEIEAIEERALEARGASLLTTVGGR